jgi:hypothetical protein
MSALALPYRCLPDWKGVLKLKHAIGENVTTEEDFNRGLVTTGPFVVPQIPDVPGRNAFDSLVLHSQAYKGYEWTVRMQHTTTPKRRGEASVCVCMSFDQQV